MAEAPEHSYDVTACIVTHHSDIDGLRNAIESFNAATCNTHLDIVDNASSADYRTQLDALACNVIDAGSNAGFGHGHNVGLRHAPSSRYHLVLNPDVVIHKDALESMVRTMDAHPEIGLLGPKILNPDDSIQPLNKRAPTVLDLFLRRFAFGGLKHWAPSRKRVDYFTMQDVGYNASCEVDFMSGCFMLFRRDALEALGGFDERFFMYLEDADITRRMHARSKVMYYPDASITHAWQRGSHKSMKLFCVMLHSMWVYFNKWGWRWW